MFVITKPNKIDYKNSDAANADTNEVKDGYLRLDDSSMKHRRKFKLGKT